MARTAGTVLALVVSAACGGSGDDGAIAASGHVEATEIRISAEVGGRLEELAPREGDAVQRGDALARVDTQDVELALEAARAERSQAAAELRLLRAGAREEDIAEARARADQAAAELEGAQRELDRMERLLESGSGTAQARDATLTRRDAAASGREAARERLRRLEAGSRPEEIDAARARLDAAEARIAQLEKQLADAVVTSPVAAVVTERLAEPGELVTRGSGLLVLTQLEDAWLNIYVGEPDLGRIRIGQEVAVTTDGGETRTGHVTFVASRAEFTPRNVQTRDERVKLVFRIKVGLENADGLFKPGMPAEARLQPVEAAP